MIAYLKDAAVDAHERHVEGSAAEIEDEHGGLRLGLLVESVGDRGGRRLHLNEGNDLLDMDRNRKRNFMKVTHSRWYHLQRAFSLSLRIMFRLQHLFPSLSSGFNADGRKWQRENPTMSCGIEKLRAIEVIARNRLVRVESDNKERRVPQKCIQKE